MCLLPEASKESSGTPPALVHTLSLTNIYSSSSLKKTLSSTHSYLSSLTNTQPRIPFSLVPLFSVPSLPVSCPSRNIHRPTTLPVFLLLQASTRFLNHHHGKVVWWLLVPHVPGISAAAKWTRAINQERVLAQSILLPCVKALLYNVRSSAPLFNGGKTFWFVMMSSRWWQGHHHPVGGCQRSWEVTCHHFCPFVLQAAERGLWQPVGDDLTRLTRYSQ